jgi:hypothetical protein
MWGELMRLVARARRVHPCARPPGGALTRPLDWKRVDWLLCPAGRAAVGVPSGRIGGWGGRSSLQLQWVVYRGGLHRLVAVDPRRVVGQDAEIVARSA